MAADTANTKKNKSKKEAKPKEYNPRWKGYSLILFTSLVSFASISNIKGEGTTILAYSISVGVFTFSTSFLILATDRLQCWEPRYTKSYDGKIEGGTLLFFVVWWTFGLGFMTQADGIAYNSSNIYFSSWLAFFSCLYTLDKWADSKDIISFRELTALSATLKSWYLLCFCSLVVMGSAADLFNELIDSRQSAAAFAIALGGVTFLVTLLFILVHYKFFPAIKKGGWAELSTAFFLVLCWTIGVAVITQDDGIGGSIGGECTQFKTPSGNYEILLPIPGSNLYVSSWGGLLSSINICLRWKAAQALQFAHASGSKHRKGQATEAGAVESEEDEDDDDESAI